MKTDRLNRLTDRLNEVRSGVLALPAQARAIVYAGSATVALVTVLVLANVMGWWISAASDVATVKPRISRLLGYIEAAPRIDLALAEVEAALASVAIEDTGDSGRGGALLQQQLRQLASDVGLTVVGSEVKEPEALDALVKLNATLQVTGGPDDFDEFFQRLYRASPALFPEVMRIEALRRINRRRLPSTVAGTEDHVSARVDIAAYRMSHSDA